MGEQAFLSGNEAIGYGALYADCKHFFAYPITPQNEIMEFFARELPKRGGVFVQTESETSTANMLYGAAATGVRAMTSSSSTGFSLMQEAISAMAAAELACVIVNVQRGGPGAGTTQTSQMDYLQVTKGGGHGDYHTIVLAPSYVQEAFDFVQLAFYLSDKYRHPTLILSDALLGQMMELIELRNLEFDPVPEKDWAVGSGRRDGQKHLIMPGFVIGPRLREYLTTVSNKYQIMKEKETRYEARGLEDAELVLVSFGSTARATIEAFLMCREDKIRVGMIRPVTLWPFPSQIIKETSGRVKKFLVVEDNLGQMVEDVMAAVQEQAQVYHLGVLERHLPGPSGLILPESIYEEAKKIYGK
jgi:2-oxoglutarate ferredoxin oxidoreductase subunit alpha